MDWPNVMVDITWTINYSLWKFNFDWWQWCWCHRYVGDFMMVTDLRCWWQNHYVGDFFFLLCWWFFQCIKSVTNILNLSPTHLVSNIRHQHQCNRLDCPDQTHFIFEINVGKRRIRPTCRTNLKDTTVILTASVSEKTQFWPTSKINWKWQNPEKISNWLCYPEIEFLDWPKMMTSSDPILSDIDFKNKMVYLPLTN